MSFVSSLYHCVWSTKGRRPMITADLELRLHALMGGIAKKNKMQAICIGGVADHVHLLLSIHQTMAVSKAVQLIKGGSSKWVHNEFPQYRSFEWQAGYGAFSIGVSHIDDTKRYIQNQKSHHAKRDFKTEFLAFLDRHGISYDPQYIWD